MERPNGKGQGELAGEEDQENMKEQGHFPSEKLDKGKNRFR